MMVHSLLIALVLGPQASADGDSRWEMYTSQEGKFIVDFPGKPTGTFTRQSRSPNGAVRTYVAQCDTPDVLYTAEKIEMPRLDGVKAADMEAILDYWRDDTAAEFNGRVVKQKRIRLDSGAYGRDFTVEGRPDPSGGLATVRVREYLSPTELFILVASSAPDRELPDDVGHFFASFSRGTTRTKDFRPRPEPTGRPLGDWGMAIDPDGDCRIIDRGDVLEIDIPNTHHDLNADNDKLNSPRVLREVTGDFSITVKVAGDFTPNTTSTNPKAVPYIGGGIVIWQDSNNYIFLGRAAINRGGRVAEFAAFEEREFGTRGALNNRGIEPGGVYLRIERRDNRIYGYTSKDGRTWARLDPMEPTYPDTLKVGIYGINGCTEPVQMTRAATPPRRGCAEGRRPGCRCLPPDTRSMPTRAAGRSARVSARSAHVQLQIFPSSSTSRPNWWAMVGRAEKSAAIRLRFRRALPIRPIAPSASGSLALVAISSTSVMASTAVACATPSAWPCSISPFSSSSNAFASWPSGPDCAGICWIVFVTRPLISPKSIVEPVTFEMVTSPVFVCLPGSFIVRLST